jgi:hypothetical protein
MLKNWEVDNYGFKKIFEKRRAFEGPSVFFSASDNTQ